MKVEIDEKTYCVETLIFDNKRLREEVVEGAKLHRLILDKIRAEIDSQEKWLSQAGYTPYNVDIAFHSIRLALAERSE